MTDDRRKVAALRRAAAEQAGMRGGDAAFRAYRSMVPGVGERRAVTMKTQPKAQKVMRNGKETVHTEGFFTRYEQPYPMWDEFGPYHEVVARGAGRETIASRPEVAFLLNHRGMTMARTASAWSRTNREPTLVLEERAEGGWHDAWLNPERQDVSDLLVAIQDGDIDQMSFAFMIPDGKGMWSEDFTEFRIGAYDLDHGDVSAVNFGASPYTDISARSSEVLQEIRHLPAGARREAFDRLSADADIRPAASDNVRRRPGRERIVLGRGHGGSKTGQRARMHARIERTAARLFGLARSSGMAMDDLPGAVGKLPWYEIRNAAGEPLEDGENAGAHRGVASVYVYDEIGGSMGVDPETFARDLREITAPTIHLRINSPGGSVFDGMAIRSSLMAHPAHVVGFVDGIAASAASVIALGADEIVTMPGAQWMLHDASSPGDGNQREYEALATWLGRQSDNIASVYARHMGIEPAEARQMMLDETWAFDEESVELGLAHRIGTRADAAPEVDPELSERMARSHDLTKYGYRYESRAAAPAPRQTRSAAADGRMGARAAGRGDSVTYDYPAGASERSTAPQATGRSIQSVEAWLLRNED